MQHVLTQEELDALVQAKEIAAKEQKDMIQRLCTMVADHMPLETPNWEGKKLPWTCILSVKGEHYCDGCPVQDMCPHPYKNWSQ